jgi:hypothetical protein
VRGAPDPAVVVVKTGAAPALVTTIITEARIRRDLGIMTFTG